MRTQEEINTIEAMKMFGGSFVQRLAFALEAADQYNFKILKDGFPNFWNEYYEMGNKVPK